MSLKRRIKKLYHQILPNIAPYNFYHRIVEKQKHTFVPLYVKYVNEKGSQHRNEEGNPFDSVVSVQGFGYSGSGAVLDLLCETELCEVVGTFVNDTTKDDHVGLESDFLRLAGGLFEFEKYIGNKNVFQNDALIKRFISYTESFSLFKKNVEVQKLFFDFFDNVVDLKILNLHYPAYNPYLYGDIKEDRIFFLREMSLNEYRSIASAFLNKFFHFLNKNQKSILVFDQLLCDLEFDLKRYNSYIPGCKLITVYRDPRDVYAFACNKGVDWISHDNVTNFIKWYRIMVEKLDLNSKEYLVVQFEKIINNYEEEKERIFNFLGFSSEMHISELRRTFLNPDISRRGIGLWKTSTLPRSDYNQIYEALSDYCYNI